MIGKIRDNTEFNEDCTVINYIQGLVIIRDNTEFNEDCTEINDIQGLIKYVTTHSLMKTVR